MKLSPKLKRVVAEDAIDCLRGDLKLTKKDIGELSRLLSDRSAAKDGIDRKRAVNAFAQVADSEQSLDVLAKVLLDSGDSLSARLSAAAALGRLANTDAEKPLLKALTQSDGPLQREIVKSLGRIGSQGAVKALAKLDVGVNESLARSVAFANLLIHHRLGHEVDVLKPYREAASGRWVKQAVKPMDKKALKERIESLRGNTFGINPGRELGFSFNCGRVSNSLLVNEDIGVGNIVKHLREKPRLAGLISSSDGDDSRSMVRFLILTQPSAEGVDIVVTRTSGEIMLTGSAQTEEGDGTFVLRDVAETGAPMTIEGRLTDKGVTLDVSTLSQQRTRTPAKIR